MDPQYLEMMSTTLPHGTYLHCPHGSHMAMHDDQELYFDGLVGFLLGSPR